LGFGQTQRGQVRTLPLFFSTLFCLSLSRNLISFFYLLLAFFKIPPNIYFLKKNKKKKIDRAGIDWPNLFMSGG